MRSIDVSDLPEPVARALEVAAEMARQAASRERHGEKPPELSLWEGYVIGELRRNEIYDDRA
jgi:hypothetical protein